MCLRCDDPSHVNAVPRRAFMLGAGVAMAGLAMSRRGFAQAAKAPPKKENVLSPEESLKRLMDGNGRYVAGVARRHDFKAEREALVGGQNPFAGILSCADSRIAPGIRLRHRPRRSLRLPCRRQLPQHRQHCELRIRGRGAQHAAPDGARPSRLRRGRRHHQIDPRRHHAAGPSAGARRGDRPCDQGSDGKAGRRARQRDQGERPSSTSSASRRRRPSSRPPSPTRRSTWSAGSTISRTGGWSF